MATEIKDGQYYWIMNANTKTSLNVLNAGPPGTAVVGATSPWYQQAPNNVWKAEHQSDDTWKFLCLQTKTYMWFPNNPALTPLQVWKSVPSGLQKWTVEPQNVTASPTFFNIKNVESGLYIDLANGNPANAASVVSQQGSGPGAPNQCWVFVPSNG